MLNIAELGIEANGQFFFVPLKGGTGVGVTEWPVPANMAFVPLSLVSSIAADAVVVNRYQRLDCRYQDRQLFYWRASIAITANTTISINAQARQALAYTSSDWINVPLPLLWCPPSSTVTVGFDGADDNDVVADHVLSGIAYPLK